MWIEVTKEELSLIQQALIRFEDKGHKPCETRNLMIKFEKLSREFAENKMQEEPIVKRCILPAASAYQFLKHLYKWKPGDVIAKHGQDVARILDDYFSIGRNIEG